MYDLFELLDMSYKKLMASIEERVETLVKPKIEELGYELYDVQYVKEASNYFLRIYIEKKDGIIDLNDCETVNNGINNLLDTADYIKEQYFLEVSSTGLEKVLRKDKHLKEQIGNEIEIKLFKPVGPQNLEETAQNVKKAKKDNKTKELIGILKDFNKEEIIIQIGKAVINVDRKNISVIKTVYNWDEI